MMMFRMNGGAPLCSRSERHSRRPTDEWLRLEYNCTTKYSSNQPLLPLCLLSDRYPMSYDYFQNPKQARLVLVHSFNKPFANCTFHFFVCHHNFNIPKLSQQCTEQDIHPNSSKFTHLCFAFIQPLDSSKAQNKPT